MPMGWGPSGGRQPGKPSTPHPWVGDKKKIAQTEAALYLQGSTAQHFKGFGVIAEHTFCGQHLRKRHFRWQAGIKSPVFLEFSVNTTSVSGWLCLYGYRNSNFLQVRQQVAFQPITEVFLGNKSEGFFFLQGWLVRVQCMSESFYTQERGARLRCCHTEQDNSRKGSCSTHF